MKRIAIISAILESPEKSQAEFNKIVSEFRLFVKGRFGIPFDEEKLAVISITVVGELDDINCLTGKLGQLPGVLVKTAISKTGLE